MTPVSPFKISFSSLLPSPLDSKLVRTYSVCNLEIIMPHILVLHKYYQLGQVHARGFEAGEKESCTCQET